MLTIRSRPARSLSWSQPGKGLWTWGNRLRTAARPPLWIVLPALVTAILALLPIIYLLARTLNASESAWQMLFRARTLGVVLNSVFLAGAVALATILIAVPLAWLTGRSDLPGRAFWDVVAALPLVVPSYVGALVVVAAFGPRGMLQSALLPFGVERLPSLYGFTGSWLTLTLFTYP